MNQYALYGLLGLGILILSLVIPGVKVVSEALFKALMAFLVEILKHKGTFMVWFIKTITSDHLRVLQHATMARDALDPTQKIRRKAAGFDS